MRLGRSKGIAVLLLCAGVTAATITIRHTVLGPKARESNTPQSSDVIECISVDTPEAFQIMESQKDQNIYWSPPMAAKIVAAAYAGDEWAIREMAWPEGHKFHKRGRQFFRNNAPHPEGLFPNAGY